MSTDPSIPASAPASAPSETPSAAGGPRRGLAAFHTFAAALLAGVAAFCLFQLLAVGAYLTSLTRGDLWTLESLAIAHRPLILFVVTGAALLFQIGRPASAGILWPVTTLVLCAIVLILQAAGGYGAVDALGLLAPAVPFVAIPFLLLPTPKRWRRRRWWVPAAMGVSLVCGTLLAGLRTYPVSPNTNRLGLVASGPNQVHVEDFRGAVNKDNYPVCRFEYNSLGYRDIEPPAETGDRRVVLVVGDSFVWGDGIPTNGETIGALLREELERKAPGRFAVMVAAYPALGPYGYQRIIRTLTPIYRPAVVLVHYVPEAHLLSDPQLLLDRLPGNAFLRNLVLAISGPRSMNEAITIADSWLSHSGVHIGESVVAPGTILTELAQDAARGGQRVILFLYGKPGQPTRPTFPLPPPLERLDLPEEWAYPGVSTDLWYAKDSHPKPALNRLVAAHLADVVLAGARQD